MMDDRAVMNELDAGLVGPIDLSAVKKSVKTKKKKAPKPPLQL